MRRSIATALLTLIPGLTPVLAQQAADWQQEVAYEMDFTLLADRHRFEGVQRLTYTNNSPDTLGKVFYHLYFNAFHPQSLMAERNRHLSDPDRRVAPRIFELGPDEIGRQEVHSLTQDGQPVRWRVYDTVMEVALAQPIMPGETTVFEMEFSGQVPLQTRRSGRDNREGVRFSMTQWYPKIAAYDAIGWHPHPYIGREFYGPFGTFDVRLTLPSEYVIGATGTLQNPDQVGHGYEQPPDAGRVATGPALRADGTPPDSLTWHFRAEQVHDFAWVADPEFIHERHLVSDVAGRDEPVHIHLLYKPEVLRAWEPMPGWMAALTRFFSERFGPYPYPQFTVAQGGDGGMEYPMLTLITGRRSAPSLFSVTAHEYAHMWFYGIVASNESLYSWIDEGFTNFATHEARHRILQGQPGAADHSGAVQAVVAAQLDGIYERPNKQADWFETNRGFGVASYSAGQAFIELLGYVMGDELRDRFLYRFATEWRWRHPYPADVLQAAQEVSGMQLYWLFDQFLDGAERYDYAATRLQSRPTQGGFASAITLERRTPGVLPVDLLLRFENDTYQWVHVPVDVAFGHKPMPLGWHLAEPWPWVQPSYEVRIEAPYRVVEAIIDPLYRTPDVDRSNNRVTRGLDVPIAFDGFFRMPRTYGDARSVTLSPIAVYSDRYGLGGGMQVRARAPMDRREAQLALTFWPAAIADPQRGAPAPWSPPFPTAPPTSFHPETAWHDGIDYTLRLRQRVGRHAALELDSRKFVGIMESRLGARINIGGRRPLTQPIGQAAVSFAHQHRTTDRALAVLPPDLRGHLSDFGALFGRDHLLFGRVDLDVSTEHLRLGVVAETGAALGPVVFAECIGPHCPPGQPAWNANRVLMTSEALLPLGPVTLRGRLAAGIGSEMLARQKLFRLGAASVETRWREAAYSVPAAALHDPGGDANFFALSGVGPVTYLLAPRGVPTGNALLAASTVMESAPLRFPGADPGVEAVLDPLRFELFLGVGAAWTTGEGLRGEDWLADAGLGIRYDLGELQLLRGAIEQSEVLSGMRLRVALPIWVSRPTLLEAGSPLSLRWLIGVETGI